MTEQELCNYEGMRALVAQLRAELREREDLVSIIEDERDALKARLDAALRELGLVKVWYTPEVVQAMAADNDRLRAEAHNTKAEVSTLEAQIRQHILRANELRAELARHEEAPTATMIRWSIMKSQLAELREEAKALVVQWNAEAERLEYDWEYKARDVADAHADELEAVLNKVVP